jgi:hypothetical protein
MFMTRVFNLNDQLIFIARNNSLLDSKNKILAKIENDSIIAGDNVLAKYNKNLINDLKGQPLVWFDSAKAYFRGQELCNLEGGDHQERALGAAGFLFFG